EIGGARDRLRHMRVDDFERHLGGFARGDVRRLFGQRFAVAGECRHEIVRQFAGDRTLETGAYIVRRLVEAALPALALAATALAERMPRRRDVGRNNEGLVLPAE